MCKYFIDYRATRPKGEVNFCTPLEKKRTEMKRENIVVIFSIIPSFFRAASFMIGRVNVNIIKWQISSFDQIIRVKIDEQIIVNKNQNKEKRKQ